MSNRTAIERSRVTLTVIAKETLSDDMLRIWCGWDANAQFSVANEGDYLKLIFSTASEKSVFRTFTVARVDEERQRVAIDFVVHGTPTQRPVEQRGGFAHWFAHTAQAGDSLLAIGPNNKKSVLAEYGNTLFITDATAIPALESVLRNQQVAGHIITLKCSKDLSHRLTGYGLSVTELSSTNALDSTVSQLNANAITGIWCAGEYQIMRAVRALASERWDFTRQQQYFSSYWKSGMTEDGHKAFKQQMSTA